MQDQFIDSIIEICANLLVASVSVLWSEEIH